MSKEVVFIVRDDIDGSTADETIQFSLRGVSYEIDLSKANVELLDKSLQQFIEAARQQMPSGPKSVPLSKLPINKRALAERRREIRAWAARNGWPELDDPNRIKKGRVPYDAIDAYQLTHPEVELPPEILPQRAFKQQSRTRGVPSDLEPITAQDAQAMLALGVVQKEGVSTRELIKREKTMQREQSYGSASAATAAERRREKFGDKLDSIDADRRNEIRAWAIDNGYDQAATGMLKVAVLEAFFKAHPEDN